MPEALHGASSRIASNGRPSHQRAGVAASAARVCGAQAEAGERLVDARQARRVAVEREQVEVGELEQVRGLAAGRGAGVEHARAGRERPGRASSGAARCAAASWTETSPSAKPGSCVTGTGRASEIAAPPSATGVDAVRGERLADRPPRSCAAR